MPATAAAPSSGRTQKRSPEERAKSKRRWKIRMIVLAILLVAAVTLVLVVAHFDLVDRLIVPYLPAFICDALFW